MGSFYQEWKIARVSLDLRSMIELVTNHVDLWFRSLIQWSQKCTNLKSASSTTIIKVNGKFNQKLHKSQSHMVIICDNGRHYMIIRIKFKLKKITPRIFLIITIAFCSFSQYESFTFFSFRIESSRIFV